MWLPRPLVNQLLHAAQQTKSVSQGFILHRGHRHFSYAPLPANADLVRAAQQLCGQDERLFAFYRTSHHPLPPPAAAELQAIAGLVSIYLGIALDIKGVLQLRAWSIDGSGTVELDVAIREPGTGGQ